MVRIVLKYRDDDPVLEYLRKNMNNGEPLARVAKRKLRTIMFMERYARDDKRVREVLSLIYRKMRELGVQVV